MAAWQPRGPSINTSPPPPHIINALPEHIAKPEQLERSFATSPPQVPKTAAPEPPKPAPARPNPGTAAPNPPAPARGTAHRQPQRADATPLEPQHVAAPAPTQQPPPARRESPPRQEQPHQPASRLREADKRSPKARPSTHPKPKKSARAKPLDPSGPRHRQPRQPHPRRHAARSGSNWGEGRLCRSSSIQHHTHWPN